MGDIVEIVSNDVFLYSSLCLFPSVRKNLLVLFPKTLNPIKNY